MIKRGQVLFLLTSTFIVVVAWISFTIYHTWVTSTITPDLQLAITPITPDFDSSVLQRLKSRENVVPVFTLQPSITPSPTLAASPSAAPVVVSPTASVPAGH